MSNRSERPLWAGGVSQEDSARFPGEPPGTFFGDGGHPRDLFPLPPLMSRPQVLGASMSQRRRRCQNNKVVSKANEVVSALNGMYASSGASASVASSCTPNQEAALHEIFKQVKYASSHVPGCNEREAVRELLHSCPSYSKEVETTVRPYDRDLVSLPVVGSCVPELSTLLDPAGRELLKDPIGCMMLTPQEFGEVCEKNRRINPYMDVVLQKDTEKYQTFVHDLYLRGMLQFTSRPKDMACPFFVNKKNGRLRLVMDCRAINQRFRAPPLLKMAAGSSWSHVEIPAGKSLYIAQSDIKDYFYSIPLPDEIQQFFCLPSIPARCLHDWGVPHHHGGDVNVEGLAFPMFVVTPMGWSWAMYWAQRIHSYQAALGAGLGPGREVFDGAPCPSLDGPEPIMLAYADNLNVVGTDCEEVQRAKDAAVAHLRSLGFVIHEELDATSSANSLGFFIDGVAGRVSPIPQKVSKVIAALRWLHRRPRITGKFIEKIIGHCVHFFLLRRELLSVFRSLYQFVQDSYLKRQRLWRSAATEAGWAASLLSISFADLRREWNPTLIATDASLSGIAVSSCFSTTSQVSNIGKVKENWRFKVKAPIAPRKKTVQHVDFSQGLDPFTDVETVKPVTLLREDLFELDEFFPEIPETLMATENWTLQFAAQMRIREAITILEMRGILAGLRHKLRARDNFGKQHVLLNDNLAAVLCTSKGRSSVFPMLRGCRRLCALLVATNSALTVRWVPSEWNPADHGSRLWEPWRVASRRACKEEGEKALEEINRRCYPRSNVVSKRYHHTKAAGCVKEEAFVEPPAQELDQGTVGRDFPRGKVTEEESFSRLPGSPTSISRADVPGADGDQCRGSNRLHDSISGLPTFCEEEGLQHRHTKEFGQQLQLLSESFVLRRSRCQRGLQSARSSARCTSRLWGEVGALSKPALPSRLGQNRSGSNQTSSSISCGGNACGAHDRLRMPRGCSSHSFDVQLLPETKRDAVNQRGGSGGSHQDTPLRGSQPPPRRETGNFEDEHVQRINPPGLASATDIGDESHEVSQGEEGEQSFHAGLFTTSKDVGKSSCDESPPQKLRRALSTSTCRSITRQASQVEKCPGSKTQRKVAIRQQCETLRTTCPCPKGDGKVAQESQRCSGESSRYPGAEGFKVFSPLKPVAKEPVWIVEVFAGCSRLSKSFANLGFHVLAVDIEFGESNDLLQEKVQNKLLAFIKTHKVVYVWLGTPCTSWSRARKNDGGPQPLRNDDSCLFGFENLGPADAEKVRVGNALLAVSLRLIEFCISARIIWTLENPWTSRIWLTPGILALQQLNTPFVQMIRVDYCQYHMPWRKSTALLSGGFPALHNVSKVCQTKHGRCSASGRPHIILQGRDHTGMFFTLRAQPYPPRMCVAIAACFLEQFLRLDKGQISM